MRDGIDRLAAIATKHTQTSMPCSGEYEIGASAKRWLGTARLGGRQGSRHFLAQHVIPDEDDLETIRRHRRLPKPHARIFPGECPIEMLVILPAAVTADFLWVTADFLWVTADFLCEDYELTGRVGQEQRHRARADRVEA